MTKERSTENGWPMAPLGTVLAERQEVPPDLGLLTGEIPIVEKISFADGRISLRDEGTTRTKMILIRPGDLVLSGINAAKGAIAVYGEENEKPIAATIHYGAYIADKQKADVKFLWWLLRSSTFRGILKRHLPGGIKIELKARRLLPIPVPLPPLEEQRRIVARIEELAAKVEAARTLRQQAAKVTKSLMMQASSQLMEEERWEIRRLETVLAERPRNGLSPQRKVERDGRPMLRISAVSSSPTRFVDLTAHVMVDVSDAKAQPFVLQHNDVFVVRYNADMNRVAKAAIFKATGDCNVVYPDKLIRLRAKHETMIPDFLVYALGSRRVRTQIKDLAKTTAGQIGISGANVKSLQIPAPPLTEQRRIVAYLDNLQAKFSAVGALQSATATQLDALLPSILDKAFKGEL